jgi:hypothetical protein
VKSLNVHHNIIFDVVHEVQKELQDVNEGIGIFKKIK